MKLRTATIASLSPAKRVALAVIAVLLMVSLPVQMIQQSVSADKYDEAIQALQNDIDNYNNQIAELQDKADTYENAAAKLQNEVNAIQAQINLSQEKYNKLVQQIADTEQQIEDNQDALGSTIADLYVEGQVSPIEMLASSKNISDYLDKQEYQSSIRDELTATISQIKKLKADLEKQKTDVTRVLGDQKNSKNALEAKKAAQQDLYNRTKGEEAAYNSLVASNKTKQAQLREEQQAAIAAAIANSGGATVIEAGAAPNYPWNGSNCPMIGYYSTGGVDGNGTDGYGYGCRQCVSYAAWRVARETGYYPVNWGNATNVPESAQAAGYDIGYTPKAGSLAVMRGTASAPEGHVVWVEADNGDGTLIVSQYNYNYGGGWGMYSKMKLSASIFQVYVYIK